jgi:hypothetical protein
VKKLAITHMVVNVVAVGTFGLREDATPGDQVGDAG